MDIKIPFLGDGIDNAVVLSIMVAVGDTVQVDDVILELETDKAVAPVPATQAGKITAIKVSEGATVSEGMIIGTLAADESASSAQATQSTQATQATAPVAPVAPAATPASAPVAPVSQAVPVSGIPSGATGPYIQQLAQQLGLDLSRITPTNGRISIDDVRRYIAALQAPKPGESPRPDFAKWGDVSYDSISSLRSKIAAKMTEAWRVPHVTQFHTCDVTGVMALRKQYNPAYKAKGTNLTITAMAVKAAITALQEYPVFNSSFDETQGVSIIKHYYNIGIAVETPVGLMVPVIHNADSLSLFELSVAITKLAEKARNRSLGTVELQGGTFTITNLGGLGVGPFTPIINVPEVAIMGLGRGENNQQPLALSYDHRVIDGADGARFMTTFATALSTLTETQIQEALS